MGSPMASQLVKAGFDVTVYDAPPEQVSIFAERHGGRGAGSVAALGDSPGRVGGRIISFSTSRFLGRFGLDARAMDQS